MIQWLFQTEGKVWEHVGGTKQECGSVSKIRAMSHVYPIAPAPLEGGEGDLYHFGSVVIQHIVPNAGAI